MTGELLLRILRAPVFIVMWAVGVFGAFLVVGSTTIGAWLEPGLRLLGYRGRSTFLPPVLGIIGFVGLVMILPGLLGSRLIGWPGAVFGPIIALGILALLGRW